VEAKEATVDEEGNIEYWYCETCREVWTDEACTEATTWEDVVLPKKDAPDVPPQTGDNELFVLMGAMTAVSMLAVVVLLKKKNYIFAQ
jgi:LPXTG-motif cell wall-anchored protein